MGGQAQVVTFAVDALLVMGEPLSAVIVLHLDASNPRVKRALAQLRAEFRSGRYNVALHPLPISDGRRALAAIRTSAEAEAVWAFGRDLLLELKQHGHTLHLCIAGGPRLVALTLTATAMLHCDHQDRLWHLYTPRDFLARARDGAILHAPEGVDVHLIPVPLLPWGSYFPALRILAQPVPTLPIPPDEMTRCRTVWAHLTPRQRDVLRALAQGLLPQEAADTLHITLKTLDSHKTHILAECRIAWEIPEDQRLDYHFLREKFARFVKEMT